MNLFVCVNKSSIGCTVTPCSVLSKASCQSLDDERGAGLFPEEGGGVLVRITICEKSPAEALVAMVVDKCYEVVLLCYAVLTVTKISILVGCVGDVSC
jgi:hypothetical protein